MASWLPMPASSHFSLANIPFGIISTAADTTPRPAIAIGDHALDLRLFAANGGFAELGLSVDVSVFGRPTLNAFAALGRPVHGAVRKYLQDIFSAQTAHPQLLKDNEALRKSALLPRSDVQLHLPLQIGDYTDFCAGKNHAFNLGSFFSGPEKALHPNYTHLPIAYHGRASSVVVSGTPITRPNGQILPEGGGARSPIFTPCRKLDIELELGAFVSRENALGRPVSVAEAADSIFGFVLVNDWSARDVQAWELVPLGPFNSKNFATSISAWVVLADALEPFRATGIPNDTALLPYLREQSDKIAYDIRLQVDLTAAGTTTPTTISRSNARNLLYSFPQLIAHHTVGGCPLRVGDLLASGTISGAEHGTQGSLVELSAGGKQAIAVAGGERIFLHDGDRVTFSAGAGPDGGLVGFGECTGVIEPAPTL